MLKKPLDKKNLHGYNGLYFKGSGVKIPHCPATVIGGFV
jgi:hypothetical protein